MKQLDASQKLDVATSNDDNLQSAWNNDDALLYYTSNDDNLSSCSDYNSQPTLINKFNDSVDTLV